MQITRYERPWGYVYEFISKTDQYTISTEHILPGRQIAWHYHKICREIEIVLEGSLRINGEIATTGQLFIWEPGVRHQHDNRDGDREAVILTLSFPHWDPSDEIFVDDET